MLGGGVSTPEGTGDLWLLSMSTSWYECTFSWKIRQENFRPEEVKETNVAAEENVCTILQYGLAADMRLHFQAPELPQVTSLAVFFI